MRGLLGLSAGLFPRFSSSPDSIPRRKPSQSCVDPLEIHERAGGTRSSLPDARPMALRALCGAFLLIAAFGVAQEQPQPLQPPVQESLTSSEDGAASVLATVHGVVRNAVTGEPLPRALVRIEGGADTGTLTDGEGRFELSGVPVGPQTIRVRKPGYFDRPYATEDVGYQGDGPAHNVLVAAEMPDLDFALSPTSAIHGHVELSTGDAGQGITLTLLKQVVRNGRAVWAQNGTTKTNGEGAFRFAGLPGGVYALYTQPSLESEPAVTVVAPGARVAREGYASVFYPGAREFSGATRIRLKDGQQAEANLLLTPEAFYTIAATAILPNGRPFEGRGLEQDFFSSEPVLAAAILDVAGNPLAYTAQFDATTHTIQAILPDGSYTLLASATSAGDRYASTHGSNAERPRATLTVLSGFAEFSVERQAPANLRIPLSPMPGWPIELRAVRTSDQPVQAGTSASRELQRLVTVTASSAGEAPVGEANSSDTIADDAGEGQLEMNGVAPGPHWINVQVNDRSLCVGSFSAGGINLAREPLNVALGASPPSMELTLRDDCASLALSLPPPLAEFLPGDELFYTVYVVPDFDTTADIPPMNMHPSSGATLTVDGLTPGNYHVYVFDRPVRLEYRNPDAIAALPAPGQAVTLTAGSTSSLMLEVPQR